MSEAAAERFLDRIPCGFLSFGDDGRISLVNAPLLDLLGCEKEELQGAHIETVFTISSRIFYQTHFFPMLMLHEQVEEVFLSLQAKGGKSIPVLAYARREKGTAKCVFVPVRERQKYEEEILTAKRAAEAALQNNEQLRAVQNQLHEQSHELERRMRQAEQKNRELLDVTRILYHDLREPMRKIETFVSLILEGGSLDQESNRFLSRISSASTRMNLLIHSLQEFVSIEAHDEVLQEVELNKLVKDALDATRKLHPDCTADFHANHLPAIEGFERQLHLLFLHLLDNAFKFRGIKNEVKIHLEATLLQHNTYQLVTERYRYTDFVQILLTDDGVGIAAEHRETVFELLQRTDPAGSQGGCGLAICRKIVENHYGSIAVLPRQGRGTTFKILLPLKQR